MYFTGEAIEDDVDDYDEVEDSEEVIFLNEQQQKRVLKQMLAICIAWSYGDKYLNI